MFVVRYIALVALVIWLGATLSRLAPTVGPLSDAPFDLVVALSGAAIVAALFVMKFVGPPPQAFTLRTGLAMLVTAFSLYAGLYDRSNTVIMTINVAIGLVLLAWYARE